MANVKILRLTTGEDIIAEVISEGTSVTKIKQPFTVVPMQESPGKPVQIAFSPYIPYGECEEVDMKSANIIAQVEPKTDLKNSYNQHTGSGVVEIAKPQLITQWLLFILKIKTVYIQQIFKKIKL